MIGRIVDENSRSVSGIRVELLGISGLDVILDAGSSETVDLTRLGRNAIETITESNGVFRFEGVYPRAIFILCIDRGGSRATCRIIDFLPGPGETVNLGDIILHPTMILRGKVVDSEGRPVRDSRVRAIGLPARALESGLHDFRRNCSILTEVHVFGKTLYKVVDPPSIFYQFFDLLVFSTSTTDERGEFQLENIPPDLISLVAEKSGYVTAVKQLHRKKGEEFTNITKLVLDPGKTLLGIVLDHHFQPVQNAEVRVATMFGAEDFSFRLLYPPVFTRDDGSFTFHGAPPLFFFVATRCFDSDPWIVDGPFNPMLDQPVIQLPQTFALIVEVVDNRGHLVVDSWIRMRLKSRQNLLKPGKYIDGTHRFESSAPGFFELEDLAPGEYEIQAGAAGFSTVVEEIDINGRDATMRIVLETACRTIVKVLTEDLGIGLERAEVCICEEGRSWIDGSLSIRRKRTDREGLAVFEHLAPNRYKVVASHPGFATGYTSLEIVRGEAPEEATFSLSKGGTLEGVVITGSTKQSSSYFVALSSVTDEDFPEVRLPRLTITDEAGRFRLANLEPGAWHVVIRRRLLDKSVFNNLLRLDKNVLAEDDATVFSGKVTHIEMSLDSMRLGACGTVRGRVFVDGVPAEKAVISILGKRPLEVTVDTAGFFVLDPVPIGRCTLTVLVRSETRDGYAFTLRRTVRVEENRELVEDFEIFTGAIAGRVVRLSDGCPVAGVKVRIWIKGDDSKTILQILSPHNRKSIYDEYLTYLPPVEIKTITDLDGTFYIEGVPAGVYLIKAEKSGYGSRELEDLVVTPNCVTGPIDLKLISPVLLSGRVEISEDFRKLLEKQYQKMSGLILFVKARNVSGNSAGRMVTSMLNLGEYIGCTKLIEVDQETGVFSNASMLPGFYTATVLAWPCFAAKPIDFVIPTCGLTNLVLTPNIR